MDAAAQRYVRRRMRGDPLAHVRIEPGAEPGSVAAPTRHQRSTTMAKGLDKKKETKKKPVKTLKEKRAEKAAKKS